MIHKRNTEPSDSQVVTFMCPECHVNAVQDDDIDATKYSDIRSGDCMLCENCHAGFTAEVSNGIVHLLNIEEHEFDNDRVGAGEPISTMPEEDLPAIQPDEIFTALNITEENAKMKYATLVDKLTRAVKQFMISEGFSDKDVVEYFTVDVSPTDDGQFLCVEVRAELNYDGMLNLSGILDDIVQEAYSDAYFDMDQPGIITAYIPANAIVASESVDASLVDYGGAFDIDPYSFWTHEDLVELANAVTDFANTYLRQHGWYTTTLLDYSDAYLEDDYSTITLEFYDAEYNYLISQKIDMRKIKSPNDLVNKYTPIFGKMLIEEYESNHN